MARDIPPVLEIGLSRTFREGLSNSGPVPFDILQCILVQDVILKIAAVNAYISFVSGKEAKSIANS
jgi:hypothetical protein